MNKYLMLVAGLLVLGNQSSYAMREAARDARVKALETQVREDMRKLDRARYPRTRAGRPVAPASRTRTTAARTPSRSAASRTATRTPSRTVATRTAARAGDRTSTERTARTIRTTTTPGLFGDKRRAFDRTPRRPKTRAERIATAQESVKTWSRGVALLNRNNISQEDPLYRKMNSALKRAENRLNKLESRSPLSQLFGTKQGSVSTRRTPATSGRAGSATKPAEQTWMQKWLGTK